MKMGLMAIGGAVCLFGLVDFIGSFAGFDLWGGFLGIQLPETLWRFSAYLELIAGYFIFKAGMASSEEADASSQEA